MSYNSKFTGKQIEDILDDVSNKINASEVYTINQTDKLITNVNSRIDEITTYNSSIEDKHLEVPNSVGGIDKGIKINELEGKTYAELFDDMLFPTVYPTFTSPSASISLIDYSTLVEVGVKAPSVANFYIGFNAGAITLNGVKQNNRSGNLKQNDSFIYWGGSTYNTNLPTLVGLGATSYQYHAGYEQGPQPKDNKGNDYSAPLSEGSVNSSPISINGTYPWYASTSAATSSNPVVKQPLIAWGSTNGSMSTGDFTVQPSGTLDQVFKLPRKMQSLQMLNTVSGKMESINMDTFTETTEILNINGNARTYYVYTYNGATRGSVTLKATF